MWTLERASAFRTTPTDRPRTFLVGFRFALGWSYRHRPLNSGWELKRRFSVSNLFESGVTNKIFGSKEFCVRFSDENTASFENLDVELIISTFNIITYNIVTHVIDVRFALPLSSLRRVEIYVCVTSVRGMLITLNNSICTHVLC